MNIKSDIVEGVKPLAGGKRGKQRENNRDAILHAATRVFGEVGFGATTVRDIIRRTGLATGTFYNYFDSKEAVFDSLVLQVGETLRARLREARVKAPSFEIFIEQSFRAYFTYYAEHRDVYMMMRANQTHNGSILGPDSDQLQAGMHELRTDIEQAMRDGVIPELDIDFLTAAIAGVGFSLVEQMMLRPTADPEPVTQFATLLFLHGAKFDRNS
jgi:AcrR family transcriptional regulator